MIAPVDILRGRLRHVRGSRADCPACGSHGALSFHQGENGAALVTCFSCHDTPGVLAAVGLELADLFPERIRDDTPDGRRAARQAFKQTAWAAALRVLGREATTLLAAAGMIKRRATLTDHDIERVRIASQRIQQAQEILQ
jgi:hypothetical protein